MRQKLSMGVICILALTAGVAVHQWIQWDFKTLDQKSHQWRDYTGTQVVINYFAEWCGPCLKEIPQLNQFAKQNPDTPIFMVSYDDLSAQELQDLVAKYDIQVPVVLPSKENQMITPLPQALPTTYLKAKNNQIEKRIMGEITVSDLERELSLIN